MNSLFNTVRHRVSADKNRYRNGTFDLDLTYITDRIVGKCHSLLRIPHHVGRGVSSGNALHGIHETEKIDGY